MPCILAARSSPQSMSEPGPHLRPLCIAVLAVCIDVWQVAPPARDGGDPGALLARADGILQGITSERALLTPRLHCNLVVVRTCASHANNTLSILPIDIKPPVDLLESASILSCTATHRFSCSNPQPCPVIVCTAYSDQATTHLDPCIQPWVAAPEVIRQSHRFSHAHSQLLAQCAGAHPIEKAISQALGVVAILSRHLQEGAAIVTDSSSSTSPQCTSLVVGSTRCVMASKNTVVNTQMRNPAERLQLELSCPSTRAQHH